MKKLIVTCGSDLEEYLDLTPEEEADRLAEIEQATTQEKGERLWALKAQLLNVRAHIQGIDALQQEGYATPEDAQRLAALEQELKDQITKLKL